MNKQSIAATEQDSFESVGSNASTITDSITDQSSHLSTIQEQSTESLLSDDNPSTSITIPPHPLFSHNSSILKSKLPEQGLTKQQPVESELEQESGPPIQQEVGPKEQEARDIEVFVKKESCLIKDKGDQLNDNNKLINWFSIDLDDQDTTASITESTVVFQPQGKKVIPLDNELKELHSLTLSELDNNIPLQDTKTYCNLDTNAQEVKPRDNTQEVQPRDNTQEVQPRDNTQELEPLDNKLNLTFEISDNNIHVIDSPEQEVLSDNSVSDKENISPLGKRKENLSAKEKLNQDSVDEKSTVDFSEEETKGQEELDNISSDRVQLLGEEEKLKEEIVVGDNKRYCSQLSKDSALTGDSEYDSSNEGSFDLDYAELDGEEETDHKKVNRIDADIVPTDLTRHRIVSTDLTQHRIVPTDLTQYSIEEENQKNMRDVCSHKVIDSSKNKPKKKKVPTATLR